MSRLNTMTEADVDRLREALRRLAWAADGYAADQSRATDPRCGLVQPVTVADGVELLAALREAWEVLDDRR
jgi:hypothetical protein